MVASLQIGTVASYYARAYYHGGERQLAARWFARQNQFGLTHGDVVDPSTFERLHAGLDLQGRSLLSTRGRQIEGIDLCFSPGKSISIVYALSDDETLRTAILDAHHGAVRAALALLEDEAIHARRGRGGLRREKTALTAALFTHDSARPERHADGAVLADPQLHTHAVILHLCRRADGSVGGIDTRLGPWKMCVGAVYHAHLAARLRGLGFGLQEIGRNGTFEIEGVTPELRELYSARRESVLEHLEAAGLGAGADAKAAAHATLATRWVKPDCDDTGDRFGIWQARARACGFEPARVIDDVRRRAPHELVPEEDPALASRLAATPESLTASEAAFPRRELLRHVAAAHVGTSADPSRLVARTEALVRDGAIVEVRRSPLAEPIYSTPEMVRVEASVRALAHALAHRPWRGLDRDLLDAAADEAGLSDEQRRVAMDLAGSNALAFLEGRAGTGKTRTLRPLVAQLQRDGYRVIAAAQAWRTALMLGEELGIEARAVDAWLARERAGGRFCEDRTVLLVDEAGQLGARTTLALLEAVRGSAHADTGREGGKMILVGDRGQLQPIAAGAGLSIIGQAVEGAALTTVRRQRQPGMRRVVAHLARGAVGEALGQLERLGAVIRVQGPRSAVRAAVDAWEAAIAAQPAAEHLLLARTNVSVHRLNQEVRRRRRERQELTGDDVTVRAATPSGQPVELPLAVGDRLRFGVRVDALDVVNGSTGVIESIVARPEGQALIRLRFSDGRAIAFGTQDMVDRQGWVRIAHDYAITVYQAQGITAESCTVHLDTSFDRHDTYVAASRSRGATKLVLDEAALDLLARADRRLDATHGPVGPDERQAALVRRLSRQRQKTTTLNPVDEDPAHKPATEPMLREQVREITREL